MSKIFLANSFYGVSFLTVIELSEIPKADKADRKIFCISTDVP